MKKIKLVQVFFITLSFLICPLLLAQKDSGKIYTQKLSGPIIADSAYFYADTNLYGVHQPNPFSALGNIGLTQLPMLFQYKSVSLENRVYIHDLNVPVFRKEDVKFCRSSKPIFSVYAFSGRGQEQLLDAFHTQTLRKQFSYTFRFYRGNSVGFVNKQRSSYSQFYLGLNVPLFKNGAGEHRLKLMPYLINNSNNFNENGGAISDSALNNLYKNAGFLSNSSISLLRVNITTANRRITNLAFGTQNTFTLRSDTLSPVKHFLIHQFHFDRERNKYEDTGPSDNKAFYPIFYKSKTIIKDTMHLFLLSNSLSYRIEKRNYFLIEAGIKQENTKYINDSVNRYYDNYGLFGSVFKRFKIQKHLLAVKGTAQYQLIGNLSKSFSLESHARYERHDTAGVKYLIEGRYQLSNRPALLFYQNYSSNNFKWINNFDPIINQQFQIHFAYLPWKLQIGNYFQTLQNHVFINQFQYADQTSRIIVNNKLFLSHAFNWKRIHFNNTINLQSTSDKAIVQIPSFTTSHALFYESKLIKNNLRFQLGIDVQYIPSFSPNNYSPALNQFYLQSGYKNKDIIYADAFFNLYIRPAYIFFKMEHVNQFYFPQQSELVESYLLKPRALRFGVRWNFWD
jgi:hypothetical protein